MDVLVEQAQTYEKCLEKIHKKYGKTINILRTKTSKQKILFGLIEKPIIEILFSVYTENPTQTIANLPAAKNLDTVWENFERKPVISDDTTEKIKILESAYRFNPKYKELLESYIQKAKEEQSEQQNQEKVNIEAVAQLAEKLESMMEKINSEPAPTAIQVVDRELPTLKKIQSILEDNDFSFSYINDILTRLKEELTYKDLANYAKVESTVLQWIKESIVILEPPNLEKTRNIALVGPTGVGKTTTLAKLAAFYFKFESKRKQKQQRVKVITTDFFRIGAVSHMERYCEVMGIDFCGADTIPTFVTYLTLYQNEADVVCIDTAGRAANDTNNIKKTVEYFEAAKNIDFEMYLTVAAGTKTSDLREIFQQYGVFNYTSLIITKFDETLRIGNLLSALKDIKIPISYITFGQTVPRDFGPASKKLLLSKLKGFSISADEEE
ncbi:flagellar biosynthesis protein FlhF [Treponema phagedenis]|uniref:Flagellar biosynthesis protein FlhF n=1 Tax=Treponema phagedenis TaxID=162 RepID=A0A0B7H254_TREPH|nr:flagellar biosynthesis protein FlhF [Treponema phagedenis]NVP24128.1 flagellar biosynthesis protein FlhF [Treponema phagedenis]QEJ96268.1 flagellar biosynthesis protein FlhF [Treponema phagedenis]QEJ99309.1 flagellar biosynthesis protein FlhF [Treponema phagedenis]QEK00046.1 flagellar biosynthesis protein FlhF [Treponema phagedenis]QEK04880.1 flagellar biosynthesis protein FlhF [Treponema phagedenis]